jgi:thioredoxin reductase (NADPH)
MPLQEHYKVIIIGSGPAGLTAAIYTARANLAPLVLEGSQPGGQLTLTTEVENYPGFAEGILGPDLMDIFRKQAARFGTELYTDDVTQVDLSHRPFHVQVGQSTTLRADALIIATGASAHFLGLEAEKRLLGHGVSTCATCDGFFFRGKEVMVVGGGDAAMEEALFLTKFATKVTVVHRRDRLRASKIMQERAFQHEKIAFMWNTVVEDILGETSLGGVRAVRVRHVETNEVQEVKTDGLFLAIGHIPNTALFRDQLELDAQGYIVVQPGTTITSVEGVFAAGDVAYKVYRQAVTAAGTGCMAAMDAERWLDTQTG